MKTFIFATALAVLAAPLAAVTHAATLEEQTKTLEKTVQTVEQRRKSAIKDLNENVLLAYRDAIRIESVDTDIAEVFASKARVRVVVRYSVDFDAARQVRSTLSKYFVTNIDKADGVEPYGMIYTRYNDCVGEFCAVKKEISKYLRSSAVGIHVSFLGEWEVSTLMDGNGIYRLKPGTSTFLIDVPKAKIKGDHKPVVKGKIYDVHYCDGKNYCPGVSYSIR